MLKMVMMAVVLGVCCGAFAQNDTGAKRDMKDAGHETSDAAKDTGRGVKQGTKKAYHKTKRGTKKAAHKVEGKSTDSRDSDSRPRQ